MPNQSLPLLTLRCCRYIRAQHAASYLLLAKMHSQCWWLCGRIVFCSWELVLSNGVIVHPSSIVVSEEIYEALLLERRRYQGRKATVSYYNENQRQQCQITTKINGMNRARSTQRRDKFLHMSGGKTWRRHYEDEHIRRMIILKKRMGVLHWIYLAHD
jgi:hypothetical protein